MVCPRSVTPQTHYLAQGSQYSMSEMTVDTLVDFTLADALTWLSSLIFIGWLM